MQKKIKLFEPVVGKNEENVVKKVLRSHFWASGFGIENVGKFENEFNQYIGSKNTIAVNSGTAALHLALSVIDIKDKEVILPSLSFVSTANAIMMNGGKPVFADIEPETLCLDPVQVKKYITKKTKVILPVHFGGMPSNIKDLKKICLENKLELVEDAAHATGATYKNKKIGSHGAAVCFSFHPVKNLATLSGGAISFNGKFSKKWSKISAVRRWCGISNRKGTDYDVTQIGWNYYMNEISAAIGIIQLKKLDKLNEKRKKTAKRYANEIHIDDKMPFNNDCAYHLYWIKVKNRKNFIRKMSEHNIETGIHYRPIHKMTLYKDKKSLPITEQTGREIVSIPIHPNLTNNQINYIIKTINKIS
jgi:perosamine synthetase